MRVQTIEIADFLVTSTVIRDSEGAFQWVVLVTERTGEHRTLVERRGVCGHVSWGDALDMPRRRRVALHRDWTGRATEASCTSSSVSRQTARRTSLTATRTADRRTTRGVSPCAGRQARIVNTPSGAA